MLKRYITSNKWALPSIVAAVALILVALALALPNLLSSVGSGSSAPPSSTTAGSDRSAARNGVAFAAPQVTATATLTLTSTPIRTATSTLTPTLTATTVQPSPTVVPTDTPAPPTATAAPTNTAKPTGPTKTPKPVGPTATSKPKPAPTKDPNILPNGVRYGDHKPNLPSRVVRIASPNIKLDTSVYEVYVKNKEWEVADYAAGHNYNSKNPGEGGNIVLSGHNNYRGEVFRYLEFLKVGDTINVWTLDGKQYTYKVKNVVKLKEAGVPMAQRLKNAEVMNPTPTEQLTLITCWPYTTYTHRLIVTAVPAN